MNTKNVRHQRFQPCSIRMQMVPVEERETVCRDDEYDRYGTKAMHIIQEDRLLFQVAACCGGEDDWTRRAISSGTYGTQERHKGFICDSKPAGTSSETVSLVMIRTISNAIRYRNPTGGTRGFSRVLKVLQKRGCRLYRPGDTTQRQCAIRSHGGANRRSIDRLLLALSQGKIRVHAEEPLAVLIFS